MSFCNLGRCCHLTVRLGLKPQRKATTCSSVPPGQRVLGGSAPVNIPGSLARSSSFNSSSSLSTSPLSSLSQSLSQSLLSGAVSQQSQAPSMLAKQEHGLLGTPTSSSQNSLGESTASPRASDLNLILVVKCSNCFVMFPRPSPGLNGGAGNIWDFVSGSFSPSPSPVFSSLTSATSSADLARLFRELDEAKKKIKQWEEAWHQVKQVSARLQYQLHGVTFYFSRDAKLFFPPTSHIFIVRLRKAKKL